MYNKYVNFPYITTFVRKPFLAGKLFIENKTTVDRATIYILSETQSMMKFADIFLDLSKSLLNLFMHFVEHCIFYYKFSFGKKFGGCKYSFFARRSSVIIISHYYLKYRDRD